ncbi:hypothetical protein C2845_PM09G11140 [Panicum miliaceum]|uniref:PGG domain-containing protein n=1 Tax=Panicum miliaceum TaxID=4540 RepID=A0A3L6S3S8_PANMI|nr:hypothetical protein C2845_PM09G11140 [Panicum miliaceum]
MSFVDSEVLNVPRDSTTDYWCLLLGTPFFMALHVKLLRASSHMANGKQPELVIPLSSTAATPEPGNDRSEDSSTHEGSTGELGMATGSTRPESIDGLSTTNLLVRSPESKVAVDFELLWRLRKYLVLLGTLAVSVTYNAGLTPPGGFWTQKKDGHDAGDPILRARFFRRHESCSKMAENRVQSALRQILRKWGFHEDQRSIPQIEDVEEARKFMLMLVTFSATIIYQAGLSPPGGFWAENEENQHPATSMLRSKNLARYNLFVSCNSTSFVASLVTIILLLSPELSRHGIRSRAVKVCVVADLIQQNKLVLLNQNINHIVSKFQMSKRESISLLVNKNKLQLLKRLCLALGIHWRMTSNQKMEGQSADDQSVAKVASSKTDMRKQFSSVDDLKTPSTMVGMSNHSHKSPDTQKIANMMGQSSSTDVQEPTVMPVEEFSKHITLSRDHNGTTNNLTVEKESSDVPLKTNEIEIVRINDDIGPNENGYTDNYEGAPRQADSKENASGNLTDKHLKKSRTYLLLLAILAVSLTYQSGLNPPGGFWSKRENNNLTGGFITKDTHHRPYHLPGDPILEDNNHQRYIAFFYLNAIAFVASVVMIIMLLNRRMSDKVIKRYALQTAMIVDLLSLTGSYLMGSCRKTKNSMYVLLLLCLVFAYVLIHVLIAIHVIPEGWKQLVSQKLEHLSCKHLWPRIEPGHNQGGTVTYQAGMSPPGGVWSDDKGVSGKPGYPILQDNNVKRYDVFYYSNSVSYQLVNRESCEHGIKFYALRVCSVVALVGLLIAYAAGSCRKAKQSIYLIIIAIAVLISVVIQVFLLSSTQCTLGGPFGRCVKCLLEWLFGATEAVQESTSNKQESSSHRAKKARKRHKYLVLLAIVAASITYQAGLSPPGGFWSDDDGVHTRSNPVLNPHADFWWYNKSHMVAGNPVLLDTHPRRYKTFF